MKIVGIDLSLTSTGIVVIDDGHVTVHRVRSTAKPDATFEQRHNRLHNLRLDICLLAGSADLAILEGPSHGQARQGGQHDRAGLWWLVADWLWQPAETEDGRADGWETPLAEIPPACVKKYATGKGNAAKDEVLAAVVRRYPNVDITGNDEADALVLAAMGARHLGHPIDDPLPKAHLAGMDKVRWPEDTYGTVLGIG